MDTETGSWIGNREAGGCVNSSFCRLHVNLLRLVFADLRKTKACSWGHLFWKHNTSALGAGGAEATNMHARSDSVSKHARHDNQVAASDLISSVDIGKNVSRQCFSSIQCIKTQESIHTRKV